MKLVLFFILSLISLGLKAEVYQLFEEKGKVGMKNEQGVVVIPPSFEALGWSDGNFSVIGEVTGYRLNQQWGLINLKKEFITKALFESLTYASGEYVVARKRLNPAVTKTGCLNLRGEMKLLFSYDGIQVQGLRAIVFNLLGAKFSYGLADLQNNILVPIIYKNIYALGTLRYAVENQKGKIALFSENGKPITDFKIDSLSNFYKGYSIVYENGLQGLIDREGEVKLKTEYRAIKITDEGMISTQLPSEWLYLSDKNQVITKLVADDLFPTSSDLTIIQTGGKSGLIDSNQKIVLPVEFDQLGGAQQGKFIAERNGKWGMIKTDSEILIPFEYDSIHFQRNEIQTFIKYKGWQLLDSTGNVKSKKFYDFIGEFDGVSYKVRTKGYWGLMNLMGDEIIHCVFDSITDRQSQMVAVKFKGQYGIVDVRENWKLAPQPYPIQLVNENRYVLMQPGNAFLKNFDNEIIYFTPYRMQFKKDYWMEFLPDGSEKTISYDGLILKRTEFPMAENGAVKFATSEGLRGIKKDGKYGFVDDRGKLRVANRYDSIDNFSEGLAPAKLIGKWGFVSPQDKIVVQPNYESVTRFTNNLSIVKRNGKYGLIDKNGNPRLALRYDAIQLLDNQKFLLVLNNLKGIANEKGSVDIEPRFDSLEDLKNGFMIASRAGKLGIITTEGLDRIPMVYDKLIFDKSKNQYLGMKRSEWK
ncbi:MAG: WG repeat-containing protein [Cyclobacteriaceae bacterium]